MSFENISKGEFRTKKHPNMASLGTYVYSGVNDVIVDTNIDSSIDFETKKENTKFITYCFNLQQRLDIGCYEEVIKALESCMSELYTIHSQYGDKQNALDNSVALRESEQILNKAKK